jgi:hypothetical protein
MMIGFPIAGLRSLGRRRAVMAVSVALVLAAGTATAFALGSSNSVASALSDAAGQSRVSTAGFPSRAGEAGIFTDRCDYSHSLADDPILAPNDPGAAMHHDFYGNTSTSASSTAKALVGGKTTCTTSADASAYWTPVVYQNGVALTPGTALIYWRRPAQDSESVQSVPVGLQMIAGNEAASAPQSISVAAWTCSGASGLKSATPTPHDCASSDLRLIVTFPSCWDGHTLNAAGQKNVVYRTASGCPASNPIQIPQIVFHVTYPTSSAAGLTVSMTPTMSGSTDTEHVDFINGWNQTTLTGDVTACLATSTRCGPVTGPDATPQGGKTGTERHAKKMHAGRTKPRATLWGSRTSAHADHAACSYSLISPPSTCLR